MRDIGFQVWKMVVFFEDRHLTALVKVMEDIANKSEHAADRLRTMILKR
jgi:uncharacterized protein Yka (UPF0111/DUF47 family)